MNIWLNKYIHKNIWHMNLWLFMQNSTLLRKFLPTKCKEADNTNWAYVLMGINRRQSLFCLFVLMPIFRPFFQASQGKSLKLNQSNRVISKKPRMLFFTCFQLTFAVLSNVCSCCCVHEVWERERARALLAERALAVTAAVKIRPAVGGWL